MKHPPHFTDTHLEKADSDMQRGAEGGVKDGGANTTVHEDEYAGKTG